MKILFSLTIIFVCIFFSASLLFSQNKYYIQDEDAYFNVKFEDDIKNNTEEYSGLYEDIYPGFLETGEYAGDGYYEGLKIKFENGVLSIFSESVIEGMEADNIKEYMLNPEIKGNILSFGYPGQESINFYGKFVEGKFTDKHGKKKTVFGILREGTDYEGKTFYTFYVKARE